MSSSNQPSIEAKLVVLGSQAVGKTSLVHRFVHHSFAPPASTTSTIGASFITKRVTDADSGTVVRLQIWDTAGQERFRSISKLYYRGANAALLCYDITSPSSFTEMGHWLQELRAQLPDDTILHIVGTKADLVAEDPSKRRVPFESVVAYAAQHLYPSSSSLQGISGANTSANVSAGPSSYPTTPSGLGGATQLLPATPLSNRSSMHLLQQQLQQQPGGGGSGAGNASSGFWGLDLGWDSCHEVSASSGEGVEEVFRVITRRLVEQRNTRTALELRHLSMTASSSSAALQAGWMLGSGADSGEGSARTPGGGVGSAGEFSESGGYYYDDGGMGGGTGGSFRVGIGDKRRSWLGFPQFPNVGEADATGEENPRKRGPCCT